MDGPVDGTRRDAGRASAPMPLARPGGSLLGDVIRRFIGDFILRPPAHLLILLHYGNGWEYHWPTGLLGIH